MRPELDETLEAPAAPETPALDDTQRAPDTTATTASTPATTGAARKPGLPAGKQLGHFRIERPLGAGGMGEVYLATDLALDRPVAIKVLPDELTDHPKRRERMIREARAQARVMHPNVAHMYFIGEDDGRLYFAMEYIAGKTLAERVDAGPISVDEALALIRAAALGLREAQRHGFTHRDVKPSNLMVDSHDVLKVLDFGLAAGGEQREAFGPVAQTSLAGTPLYMAPEQARGDAVDLRADIYALGATLFHLVSGKPPFEAASVDELMSMHATAARPALHRRGIPRTRIREIDTLISKMMAPRADDRFASYDELLRAIELASTTHTRPAGFWVRSMAVFVDFITMALVFGVVSGVVEWSGGDNLDVGMNVILPIVMVYQVLALRRWGRTFGKALFELEVVDLETRTRPEWPVAIRRTLVLYGPVTVLAWVGELLLHLDYLRLGQLTIAVSIFAGLSAIALLAYAAARVSGKRALWDRAAGTMVRYRTTPTAAS